MNSCEDKLVSLKWCKKCDHLSRLNFQPVLDGWLYLCDNCGNEMALLRQISCPLCGFQVKVAYDFEKENISPPDSCPLCKKEVRKNQWIIHIPTFILTTIEDEED